MIDRIKLLKEQLQKEIAKADSLPKEKPRTGLLARKNSFPQNTVASRNRSPETAIVMEYIKQIRQSKDEILNG